jgi:hypothetical protein
MFGWQHWLLGCWLTCLLVRHPEVRARRSEPDGTMCSRTVFKLKKWYKAGCGLHVLFARYNRKILSDVCSSRIQSVFVRPYQYSLILCCQLYNYVSVMLVFMFSLCVIYSTKQSNCILAWIRFGGINALHFYTGSLQLARLLINASINCFANFLIVFDRKRVHQIFWLQQELVGTTVPRGR